MSSPDARNPRIGGGFAESQSGRAGNSDDTRIPAPDLAEARRFLSTLDPSARRWCFRTFPDAGSGAGRNFAGTLDECADALLAENSIGRGVFVVINEGGQKAKDITRVRAVFADFDGTPLPGALSARPQIVVQSSGGENHFHLYWLVTGFPLDQFAAVQKAIAAMYGSDPSVHDLSRVMRLPGFIHHKSAPFRTELVHPMEAERR